MKSNAIICAIAAASLGFSAVSFAQGNDRRGGGDEQPQYQQDGRQQRHDRGGDRGYDQRGGYRQDFREGRQNDRRDFYNARGPEFRRGGYIPREFHDRQYVVNDYRSYRLSAPPRGQQWVQVGSDFVLIAIASGLIANIVLNH